MAPQGGAWSTLGTVQSVTEESNVASARRDVCCAVEWTLVCLGSISRALATQRAAPWSPVAANVTDVARTLGHVVHGIQNARSRESPEFRTCAAQGAV